jgi:hypothetical protein
LVREPTVSDRDGSKARNGLATVDASWRGLRRRDDNGRDPDALVLDALHGEGKKKGGIMKDDYKDELYEPILRWICGFLVIAMTLGFVSLMIEVIQLLVEAIRLLGSIFF